MLSHTHQATQFTARSGKSFVYLVDMPYQAGELIYSPDGKTFYALASCGFAGNSTEHDLSFDDPHRSVSGKLHRNGDIIDYDGERFIRQDVSFDQSSVVPLPAQRRMEYFCQAEDGTLFYVDADKYNYSYESFTLYIGNGATMREVPIQNVRRYRDGGTTYIRTSEGTFFSPSPFDAQHNPELVPKWDSQRLTKLNSEDYLITTSNGGIVITKK